MSCGSTGLLAQRKDLLSALYSCSRSSLPANSDPVLPTEALNRHGQLLYEYILVIVEHHGAQTCALAWVDTTHSREGWRKRGTEGKGETSALVTHPAMPDCTGTRCIPAVYSTLLPVCMSVCAVGGEWRWRVGWRAHGSKGMLCHMADSPLGLREREKQRECGHERRAEKAVWKMPVLYKPFNLSLLGILFSLNFERKTTIVARWSDLIPM